jgi:hypothetical protein
MLVKHWLSQRAAIPQLLQQQLLLLLLLLTCILQVITCIWHNITTIVGAVAIVVITATS